MDLSMQDSKPNKTKSSSTAEAKNESKPAGPPPVPKPWERMSEATKEAQLATAMDYMQRKKLDASVQSAEKSYVRNADSILHLVRDKAWLEKEKLFMRQTEEG